LTVEFLGDRIFRPTFRVKAFEAARPLADCLPVAEGLGKVGSRELDFEDFHLLVGVTPLEVPSELAWCRAAATFDNHGSGPWRTS
jgi:hypothetical protein